MGCHGRGSEALTTAPTAALLVGNPNVGKSVLFNRLTGRYVEVSNYPGTTVEVSQGTLDGSPDGLPLIDTPGTLSLVPRSEDERVTRRYLLTQEDPLVLLVLDAKNLVRGLLLASQVAELGVRTVLVLNMADEARDQGIQIEREALEAWTGLPVVETAAVTGEGVDQLRACLDEVPRSRPFLDLGEPFASAVEAMVAGLEAPGARGWALLFLASEGDGELEAFLEERIGPKRLERWRARRRELAAAFDEPLSLVLLERRLAALEARVRDLVRARRPARPSWRERLGAWAVHPLWGWPILAAVLWATYKFVGEFGAGTLVDLLEGQVFQGWLHPRLIALAERWIPWPWLVDFLVGEYGQVTMGLTYGLAIVLPIVTTFFLAFGLLEDSGYLPRLAVMVNRPFKALGLNGKAVLPMVLGLGCDTMATLTTRILETRRERVLTTLLLALGVPCSAQLGVILGMMGVLPGWAVLTWAGVVVGTLLAVGWLAARVLPGERSDFILELPPVRWPRPAPLLVKTAARLEWYLKEVLPLFLLGTGILFLLDRTGLLTAIQAGVSPLVEGWLGLPREATGAFLIGFLRRDYGAAGLFQLARAGQLSPVQTLVSMVTITLFVPCIANLLVMVRELGRRTALSVAGFIFPFAFGVGGVLYRVLLWLGVGG